jgi:hypothetical protein
MLSNDVAGPGKQPANVAVTLPSLSVFVNGKRRPATSSMGFIARAHEIQSMVRAEAHTYKNGQRLQRDEPRMKSNSLLNGMNRHQRR